MSSGFRTQIRCYVIYCIFDDVDNTVYVGKSYAKTPRAQYRAHINGTRWRTKDTYEAVDKAQLEYIVLEIIRCTGSIAYKHILAWYMWYLPRWVWTR